MSLSALLYKYSRGGVKYNTVLILIMDMGNELYSMLSRMTGKTYLLLTDRELLEKVTLHEINYYC